jgi:hypothetical protein
MSRASPAGPAGPNPRRILFLDDDRARARDLRAYGPDEARVTPRHIRVMGL